MKKFFLLILGLALLCPRAKAQYSQNFESAGVLGTNCLDQTQFNFTDGSDEQVIHGQGSAYTNPPTSGSEVRSLTTPFLDITGDPLTISFYYQLSNKLGGQATRTIEVGLIDRYGAFSPLARIDMDKSSTADEAPQFFEQTFTNLTPGVQRVGFRITGNTGDGNSRLIYDDLYVSASPHYGPLVHCNGMPQVQNNYYFSSTVVPVSGNVLTDTPGADSDPNGETLKAVLATPPDATLGTLVFNADGSFTFTPAPGFLEGEVTFTYRAIDDGYPATSSAIATVTINYTIPITLPVHLTTFSGTLVKELALLSWSVASNETAAGFVVERSMDGKFFTAAGSVEATGRSGDETYNFTDPVPVQGRTIYRLRMTDREGKQEYSRSVLLQADASIQPGIRVMSQHGTPGVAFTYKSSHDAPVSIRVYNAAGQLLQARNSFVRTGVNLLAVESSLPTAQVYILEVVSGAGQRSVVKFRR